MNTTAKSIIRPAMRAAVAADPELAERAQAALEMLAGHEHKPDNRPPSLVVAQAEAARMLDCSRWSVRNLVRDGTLKPVCIRGMVRFRRQDIVNLVRGGA